MTTFTILLIDRNDNAPKFNSSEYRVRITELAQVGFALPLFIQAEDKDEVGETDPIEKNKTKQNHTKHRAAVRFTKGLTGYGSENIVCIVKIAGFHKDM